MKKIKPYIYWVLLTIPLLILALYGLRETPVTLPSFSVSNTTSAEEIFVHDAEDGNLYVFLPAYADMGQVTIGDVSDRSVFLGEIQISDGMNCGVFQPETPYELTINSKKTGTLWFYRSANVAAMHIDTGSGNMEKIHANKNTDEMAYIRLFTEAGVLDYSTESSTIKGRGNSSWSLDKKPYAITLEQSDDLLGLGTSCKWVLLANYTDETGLRNKLVFDYATATGPYSGFSPECALVDLYLNGQYNGQYLLCKKIEVSPDYLNLDGDDYLLELMWASRTTDSAATFDICPTRRVDVVYPVNCTSAQTGTLQAYLADFQEALVSDDGISKSSQKKWSDYIDLDSWARKYLIEELFSNFDAGQASQYFWLDSSDGKLYAGPCWDYDLTFGKQWQTDWYSPQSLLARRDWGDTRSWYGALWDKDEFRERVIALYNEEFRPLLVELSGKTIPDAASDYAASAKMNNLRWATADALPYDEAMEELTVFLNDRIAFLDAIWTRGEPYCSITLQTSETNNIYVPYNTVCTALPQPEDLRASGVWYDKESGQPFDPDAPVCKDITLIAKSANASTGSLGLSAKMLVIFLSVGAVFSLFLCLAIIDFTQRRKERRNANEQDRTHVSS